MRKRRTWKRLLALLLAAGTVLGSLNITSAAEPEQRTVVEEEQTAETEEELTEKTEAEGETKPEGTEAEGEEKPEGTEAEGEEKPEETGGEETPAETPDKAAAPALMNLLDGSGSENIDPRSTETLEEIVKQYYGENGKQGVGSLTAAWDTEEPAVLAGNSFYLNLSYVLDAAPTYMYNTQAEPMYDTYENTAISFTLPDYVSIEEGVDGALWYVKEVTQDGNRWTLHLNKTIKAENAVSGTIKVPLKLGGNGVLAADRLLDFSEFNAQIYTEFDILDRNQGSVYQELQKTIDGTQSLSDKITATQDTWVLEKTAVSAIPSEDKKEITVTFTLKAGLNDGSGNIVVNTDSYMRPGRVPFDGNVTLKELPSVLDRQRNPITATRITVTPQFGEKTPIPVTEDDTITLPFDTCGGHNLSAVDKDAPYLSEYTVEAVYPYEKFIAAYQDENQEKLTVNNTAELTYKLLGKATPDTLKARASIEAGEVTEPAELVIQKYITAADGSARPYSASEFADDPVEGPAVFTVTKEDGSAATLYEKQSDGTYEELSGNTVAIDPAKGTDGSVTVYLDPGTYTVEETTLPVNTEKVNEGNANAEDKTVELTAGNQSTAAFYNRELVGSITLTKYGKNAQGNKTVLSGAVFGLYIDANYANKIKEASSDTNGTVSFGRLAYGTYYVKEISAPEDYVADTKVYSFTIDAEHSAQTETIVNSYNQAWVQLQKQMLNGTEYVDVGAANYREFDGCFTIQRKGAEGLWTDVEGQIKLRLTENGQILASLPVYDTDGNLITYRFKETLPKGWHVPGDSAATEMYSEEFTLKSVLGKTSSDPYVITMQNDRNGSITLTKEFYDLTANGYQKKTSSAPGATFTLYYEDSDEKLVPYGGGTGGSYTTAGGKLEITDLPRKDGNTAYKYYLVETPVTGYIADKELTGENTADPVAVQKELSDGTTVSAYGPFDFTSLNGQEAKLHQTVTIKNYENTIGVKVKKENSITEAFVPGARFTVYDNSGDNIVLTEQEIVSKDGAFIKLDPGKRYLIEETVVPAGYTDVTEKGGITVDLTNESAGKDSEIQTYTLKNRPDPKLQVNKTLTGNGVTSQSLKDVSFEVYTKNGTGVFERVSYLGEELTITSGTAASLPAGTYYLKEVVPEGNPNHVLNPGKYDDIYNPDGSDAVGEEKDGSFYFGPFTVTEVTSKNNLVQEVSVENYSDLGAVTVNKVARGVDGNVTPLERATLGIWKEGETDYIDKKTTSTNGTITFKDLPIYDENEAKITYIIEEISAPKGYTISDTQLEVQLIPGETVTKSTAGADLTIVNLPETNFTVTKVFYNIWEHQFTEKEYLMSGAKIALFQKTDTDTYKFVELLTTSQTGDVTFTGLSQTEEYVAVEYSIPDAEDYRYYEPDNGGQYLSKLDGFEDETQLEGKTLSAAQLTSLYYVPKKANSGDPVLNYTKKLTNVEHWTQLHIKKWIESDYEAPDGSTTQKDGEQPINNAEFDLYMEILPESTEKNASLTYEEGADRYTLIGTYSSGTLYSTDGKRQDGWFATDILKSSDEIVYWLVERNPGTGAKVNPETEITLIIREGTNYTNGSKSLTNGEDGFKVNCTQVMKYQDDKVTKGAVQNLPATGPGSAMFSTVRIAKWAGEIDENGERKEVYTPLGNASFEIRLVHADGTAVTDDSGAPVVLDTLTTGLDNDLSGNTGAGEKTAWASSRAFSFQTLWETYHEKNKQGVAQDIIWVDNKVGTEGWEGNGYVRVMLVETGTPAGYSTPAEGIPMLMYFRYDDGKTTETFNDAFYVKDSNTEEKLAEELPDDSWALYPTTEQTDGSYEIIEGVAEKQYRIVNWPVDNFAVTLNKYGYEYNEQTREKTSAELDEYYLSASGRKPLAGVKMKIQRYYDGEGWKDYSYPVSEGQESTALFTTDDNGYFAFPKGLLVGRYRIIETEPARGYDNIYDGTSVSDSAGYYTAKAYYFAVTNKNVHISMYNPDEVSLAVLKTDTAGTELQGAEFSLKKSGSTATSADTGNDGVAEWKDIASGVYTISETSAPSGYSKEYLQKYLTAEYTGKSATVYGTSYSLSSFAGTGIYLGYETKVINTGQYSAETVIERKIDLSSYGLTGSPLALTIQDPALCSLTITKEDQQDSSKKLSDAVFKVEYKAFANWNSEEMLDDSGWTLKGENYTTGTNGTVTISNLEPGIYKVTEKTPPANYSANTTPQYIVLTGGMNKTVSWNGNNLVNDTGLTFQNLKKVSLTVTKELDTGELELNESHTFTFTLKDNNGDAVGTAQPVTFAAGSKNQATQTVTFTGLEQGKTYSLTESFSAGDDDFALTGMTVTAGGTLGTFDSASRTCTFTVDTTGADVAIKAENKYLYAEITILKVDAADGTGLEKAGFAAYRMIGSEPEKTDIGNVTEIGNGKYRIRVPLSKNAAEIFRIQEVSAPAGYVNDRPYTNVELSPGESRKHGDYKSETMSQGTREENDQAMLAELIFPNYRGSVIEIVKYDNMKEAQAPAPQEGVGFTLYVKNSGQWQAAGTPQTTDAEGKVSFTVESGKVYAIAETSVPSGYTGMQGLYDGQGGAMNSVTIGSGSSAVTAYILNGGSVLQVGGTYSYSAYNVPVVEMEVRKMDAQNSTADNPPTATVNIYEVPAGTKTNLTEDEVNELMSESRLVVENVPVTVKAQNTSTGERYSYADKGTLPALGTQFSAGKTYLIVETASSMTQLRDNRDVVWYVVHTIPAGTKEKQIVTLKNIEGTASQILSKTTGKAQYESLLTQGAELEYTISPTVSNTYPLDSYTLTDTGLTAYHGTTALDFNTYLKENYTITRVELGDFSHNGAAYHNGTAVNDLKATVTFYGFDDQPLESIRVAQNDADKTVTKTVSQKAKAVSITYDSETLRKESGYALGQNFTPGTIKVAIRLDKQEGGETVQSITKVVNTAQAEMKWTPWNTSGGKDTQRTETKTATAENTFTEQDTALVSFTKKANTTSVNLDGGTVSYDLTLTNESTAEGSMKNPFVVDLIPRGMELRNGEEDIEIITETGSNIAKESFRTQIQDGETAAFVFMNGELKPGETVIVRMTLTCTTTAVLYGGSIVNYALAGSRTAGVVSAENPRGTSWRTKDGQWPQDVDGTLTSLDESRRTTLKSMLDDMKNFGYLGSADTVGWTANSAASLVKTGMGDRSKEQGFTSGMLNTVNNDGHMQYELIFSNLSSQENYTAVTMLDIFPYPNDYSTANTHRWSQWGLTYEKILDVEKIDATGNIRDIAQEQYQIYYYTGAVVDSNGTDISKDVYAQIDELTFDSQNLPDDWSSTVPSDLSTVRAIAIAFEKDASIALDSYESYKVTCQMQVGNLTKEELAKYSYTNAVNTVTCLYSAYTNDISQAVPMTSALTSNTVDATILPDPVQVGGHIWIDKDADGIWEAGESVGDLKDNVLVQKLLENAEVRLYTIKQGTIVNNEAYNTNEDSDWKENANFIFTNLDPAAPKDGATEKSLYSNQSTNPYSPLNPLQLKGSAPSTYRIGITIPENTLQYSLTSTGAGAPDGQKGYSREPSTLQTGGVYAKEAKDNNYYPASGSSRTVVSEQFFLHATAMPLFDNTKDAGFVLNRTLTIQKTAQSNSDTKLEGAEFEIYGPFDTVEEANKANLNNSCLVGTLTTDTDGQAVLAGLNWFQVYVIVEKESASGYQLQGAKAVNADGLLENYTGKATEKPAWVLKVPDDAVSNQDQIVSVTNKSEAEYTITASKKLEGKDLSDQQFTFELLNEDKTLAATGENIGGTVTFGPFDAAKEETLTYYIREKIPQEAQNNILNEIQYDTQLYKVEIRVYRDLFDHNRLKTEAVYYRQGTGLFGGQTWVKAEEGAVFENIYLPSQTTTYTPAVTKQFTEDSDKRPDGVKFTFTLESQKDYGTAVELPVKNGEGNIKTEISGQGTAYFESIRFNQEGTYRFRIQEVNGKENGFSYDSAVWTLEVETKKVDGVLTVVRAEYSVSGKSAGTAAVFVNSYKKEKEDQGGGSGSGSHSGSGSSTGSVLTAKTGDSANPVLWLLLLLAAAAVTGGLLYFRRRKKQDEEK